MAAGVHDTRFPRTIRDVILLLNGKRIDISPYCYDRRIGLSGRDNLGDDSALTRSYLVWNTTRLQPLTDIGCCRKFLSTEFGALVYVAPNLRELRGNPSEFGVYAIQERVGGGVSFLRRH
jgi:hypothetical protein